MKTFRFPIGALVLGVFLIFLSNCASVEIQPLADSKDKKGIRFYRPAPYLFVTMNSKGQCIPSIIYLPDKSQEYIITPHAGMGSVSFKPTLQNGWNLTAFDGNVDSKTPETLNAISGMISNAMHGPFASIKTKLSPGLYSFNFDSSGIVDGLIPSFQLTDSSNNPIPCLQQITTSNSTHTPHKKSPKNATKHTSGTGH